MKPSPEREEGAREEILKEISFPKRKNMLFPRWLQEENSRQGRQDPAMGAGCPSAPVEVVSIWKDPGMWLLPLV